MQINVNTKIDLSQIKDYEKKHIPFVLAKTLTQLARESAFEVRRQLPERFRLRRKAFITSGIRYEKATKQNLEAKVIELDKLMRKQEEGPSYTGKRFLIPRKWLVLRSEIIRSYEKPKRLLERANYFINEKGVWERRPNGEAKGWYIFVNQKSYDKRLGLYDTTVNLVNQKMVARFTENLWKAVF